VCDGMCAFASISLGLDLGQPESLKHVTDKNSKALREAFSSWIGHGSPEGWRQRDRSSLSCLFCSDFSPSSCLRS
jgi:hypothetical protein